MGTTETKDELSSSIQQFIEEAANIATIDLHKGENVILCGSSPTFLNEAKEDHTRLYDTFENLYRDIVLEE